MSASEKAVGAVAVLALGYNLILIAIHMYIPHPNVSYRVIAISYASLVLSAAALALICAAHFSPFLSPPEGPILCLCPTLWTMSASSYIFAIYGMKFVYVERVRLLEQNASTNFGGKGTGRKLLTADLIVGLALCIILLVMFSEGECHSDSDRYGCTMIASSTSVWNGIIGISIDFVLLAAFCWRWWQTLQRYRIIMQDEHVDAAFRAFGVEFALTMVALCSVVIDALFNLYTQAYAVRIVFCIDCSIIASCNFALIKESRAFFWRYVCCPCSTLLAKWQSRNSSNIAKP